ncbi:MAG: hypothetical protein C0596_01615 [Marinilabiliales bacterium]|nr:MAG: hypothetical protein C0596_01615 [Marinilabiliales bacterium]
MHPYLGGNRYHTGGSGHVDTYRKFLQDVSGYSLLASWNKTLNSCNAWDRKRFDWKYPGSSYSIKALSAYNNSEVETDFEYADAFPYGNNEFILRDFVTTGDALRIKLPYVDDDGIVYPQWIWIENHQGAGDNYDLTDNATPGIYAYIQNAKEDMTTVTETGTNYTHSLTAIGNYDFEYTGTKSPPVEDSIIEYFGADFPTNIYRSSVTASADDENPFTGQHVLMWHAGDLDDDGIIRGNELICLDETTIDGHTFTPAECVYWAWTIMGTSYCAFKEGDKIGIGTNPPSTPLYTYRSSDISSTSYYTNPTNTDNRKIHLNGLSIEVIDEMVNGDIKVRIRWDNYDVDEDARWCGDIVLREEVNLTSWNVIHID